MLPTDTPRNDPTWLEYMIVYIVLGLAGLFLYRSILAPQGYTFSAGWAMLRGKNQSTPTQTNEKTPKPNPPQPAATPEPDMNLQEPPMTPVIQSSPMTSSVPASMQASLSPPASSSMPLSEEDD